MPKSIAIIPPVRDDRFKNWRRLLKDVDRTQTNGYAFRGIFTYPGRKAELEVGTLLLCYDEVGSRSDHPPLVSLCRLQSDGVWSVVEDSQGPIKYKGIDWALSLRDRVATVIEAPVAQDGLSSEERALADALMSLSTVRLDVVLKAAGLATAPSGATDKGSTTPPNQYESLSGAR